MSSDTTPITIAFVCVQNAGRSQMAYAFAQEERTRHDITDKIELVTGGTEPATTIHASVIDVMAEVDLDLSTRTPTMVTPSDLKACDIVITMGCSAEDVCPAVWHGETRDWDLDDPHGQDIATVRAIRDEIQERVTALFDEIF